MVEFYTKALSYRFAGAKELPSLEEFLSLVSGKGTQDTKAFDEKTDKFLEETALKILEERRAKNAQ